MKEEPKALLPRSAMWLLWVVALLLAFHALLIARSLFLPIAFALLLAVILAPGVRWLRRRGVSEPFGAALIILALAATGAILIVTLAEPAMLWLDRLPRDLRQLGETLGRLRKAVEDLTLMRGSSVIAASLGQESIGDRVVNEGMALARAALLSTPGLVISVASTFILLYFLLASGRRLFMASVALLPRVSNRRRVLRVARELQHEIGRFFVTSSLLSIGLGVVMAIVLTMLGVPNALFWGVTVTLLNFVPYLGPVACTLLLALVGAGSFERLFDALLVPSSYIILAAIESNLVGPWVMGRRLSLNPLVIFLAVLMWGWLWGILGTLMGVPFVLIFKIGYPILIEGETTLRPKVAPDWPMQSPARLSRRKKAHNASSSLND